MHITLEQAETAICAARNKAMALKTQMCLAIVDSGGHLKTFLRMDHAYVGSIDIAFKKARTAVYFGLPTGEIGKLSQPQGPLYGIEHSNHGLITFPGGLPIVNKDSVMIGAVGVSGSTIENDHIVAYAALEALGLTDAHDHPKRT
jgi:uncharacterized protein GlcG (DUF336 family)